MEKTCNKCKRLLPLSEFYKHPAMADGHLNKCKECCRSDSLQNRRRRVDYYRDYDRKRSWLTHRIFQRKTIWRRQKEMEPEKYHARTAAGNALRDGRLPHGTQCYLCGGAENLEMHHPDYSQPLRVYWLCRVCHRKLDGMQKIGIPAGDLG
ncbi:MAG: hypothetical protein PHC36_06740 [Eubacteriales bacterium]|jgi:hypothetical protein|nr:hypothetical protein [Eubacteriales bacterium]